MAGTPAMNDAPEILRFWEEARASIDQGVEIKDSKFPLTRIKKIMKLDEDVDMVSMETQELMAKALELFIQELTLRSYLQAQRMRRKTLFKRDIGAAVARTNYYDFLIDLVPREETNAEINRHRQSLNATQLSRAPAFSLPALPVLGGGLQSEQDVLQTLLTAHQGHMLNLSAQASTLLQNSQAALFAHPLQSFDQSALAAQLTANPTFTSNSLAALLQNRSLLAPNSAENMALLAALQNHALQNPLHIQTARNILSSQEQLYNQLASALQPNQNSAQEQQRQATLEDLQHHHPPSSNKR